MLVEKIFTPTWKVLDTVPGIFSVHQIRDEPSFHKADLDFVREHAGPLSELLLDVMAPLMFTESGFNLLVDSRVTMLMPGYLPAIPGWHCDSYRSDGKQPDLTQMDDERYKFWFCNLATNQRVSNTEFLALPAHLQVDSERVWASVDEAINSDGGLDEWESRQILPGEIVEFNQTDLHRASPCIVAGWRLFFRVTATHREPVNEIRSQVQVYITGNPGW